MYTRNKGEQQADITGGQIADFSVVNLWNMLTESDLGIIFAAGSNNRLKQTNVEPLLFLV